MGSCRNDMPLFTSSANHLLSASCRRVKNPFSNYPIRCCNDCSPVRDSCQDEIDLISKLRKEQGNFTPRSRSEVLSE